MKFEGRFEIVDENGKIVRIAHNHLVENGSRYILSWLRGGLIADGYGSATIKPSYIIVGRDQTPWERTQWIILWRQGDVAISGSTLVSKTQVRFSATWSTLGTNIGEIGLALTNGFASSRTDYPNSLIDRAVITPSYSPSAPITINFNLELKLE